MPSLKMSQHASSPQRQDDDEHRLALSDQAWPPEVQVSFALECPTERADRQAVIHIGGSAISRLQRTGYDRPGTPTITADARVGER
jgi:hypothetical protein